MLALINVKLRQPYNCATTFDLGVLSQIAKCVKGPSVPLVPRLHSFPLLVVYIASPTQHTGACQASNI